MMNFPSKEVIAATEAEVNREIAEYKATYGPRKWYPYYFNNFSHRFPNADFNGMGYLEFMVRAGGNLDKTLEEIMGTEEAKKSGHSTLYSSLRYSDFLKVRDNCLQATGISHDFLYGLTVGEEEARKGKIEHRDLGILHYQVAFHEALIPTYILLRAHGFNRVDLRT
jgi:hypothetical protein